MWTAREGGLPGDPTWGFPNSARGQAQVQRQSGLESSGGGRSAEEGLARKTRPQAPRRPRKL